MNTFELSKREGDVATLLLEGKSNKQIAAALEISEGTVEFHLTRIYAKLAVSSRTEAILRLSQPGKTPGKSASDTARGITSARGTDFGESPVEEMQPDNNNGKSRISSSAEITDMPLGTKLPSLPVRYRVPLVLGALFVLIAFGVLYLRAPKEWKKYERECEFPDEYSIGQAIGRSNASGSSVHGQFGSTDSEPWKALPGFVTYKNINTPQANQLYLKLRYSKNSPPAVPILVFLDDEENPRAAIYPVDQKDWNKFTWTELVYLGNIENGVHSIKFVTDGQQYGVADLDKFTLTAGAP